MANAVISRTGGGSESVTLPLRNTDNGIAVARDIGKPSAKFYSLGREDPKPADHLSAQDSFTVVGELQGSNAYTDAKTLAEDIIKRRPDSSDKVQLDLTDLPSGQTHDVAAVSDRALELTYPPGVRNNVLVTLSVQAVDSVSGGDQTAQSNLTPDSGSGVKLTDGTDSVTITEGLSVDRTTGRGSGSTVSTTNALPSYFDLNKSATDEFEISGQLRGSSAESTAQTLEETLIRARQGTSALKLHFLSNEFGLDAYNVAPTGSQALRTSFAVGETRAVRVETLNLKVVDPS